MSRAIERHHRKEAVVIPVVMRPVESLPHEIRHLQAIPKDLKAVTKFASENGYVEAARGIRDAVEALIEQREANETATGDSHTTKSTLDSVTLDVPDAGPLTVLLEFQPAGSGYDLTVYAGFDGMQSAQLSGVDLGASATIDNAGDAQPLGQLAGQLIAFEPGVRSWLEEPGQLKLGRKLFDETVGRE